MTDLNETIAPNSETTEPLPETLNHEPETNGGDPETDGKLPIAEAMVSAMQMQAHQHAAAVPEDTAALMTPRLPFPRPPFDFEKAFAAIVDKHQVVEAMRRLYDSAKKRAADTRKEWEEAATELLAMISESDRERKDAESGAQPELPLTHGLECDWEKKHPGAVCAVCSRERAARQAAAKARVIVRAKAPTDLEEEDVPDSYFALDRDEPDGWTWSEDVADAHVFESEAKAREMLDAKEIALDLDGGIEFAPVEDRRPETGVHSSGSTNGGGAPVGQSTDSLGTDASPDAAAAPPLHDGAVVVRVKGAPAIGAYFVLDPAAVDGWYWGDSAEASVFESEANARETLEAKGHAQWSDEDVIEFVPSPESQSPNPNPQSDDGPVEMPDDEEPVIVVGSIVVAKAQTGVCEVGHRGVCVSVALDFGFIFEPAGRVGYFTKADAHRALTVTGQLLEPLVGYEFVSDRQLKADYRKGVFAAAIGKPERKART